MAEVVHTPSCQEGPDDTDLEELSRVAREEVMQLRARSVLEPPADLQHLDDIIRPLPPTFDVAAYANRSSTLQRLAVLGVQLSFLNKKLSWLGRLLKLDWDQHIVPKLRFLEQLGLDREQTAHLLTHNMPLIWQHTEVLEKRAQYLRDKAFEPEDLPVLFCACPKWLSESLESVDERLGFLQTHFSLSGDQVRAVVRSRPALVWHPQQWIRAIDVTLKDDGGFTPEQRQQLVVENPSVFMAEQETLSLRLRLLRDKMALEPHTIVASSELLTCKMHVIANRHFFLKSIGRAQYDPAQPLYVSLRLMAEVDDEQFATDLAESTVAEYDAFLHDV